MEKFTNSEFRLSARKDGREDRVWFTSGIGAKRANDWTRAVVEINNEDDACFEVRSDRIHPYRRLDCVY